MRNDTARLLEAAQAVDGIGTVQRLTDAVANAAAPFGVSSVSVNLIVTPGKVLRPGILIGRRWRQWSDRYLNRPYPAPTGAAILHSWRPP